MSKTKRLSVAQEKVVERLVGGEKILYSHGMGAHAFYRGSHDTLPLQTFWAIRDRGLLIEKTLNWHSKEYTLNRAAATALLHKEDR